MSTTEKPLSAGATLFVMKRLAEDEAARVECLTDVEFRAVVRREGPEGWRPSSTEALL